MEKFLSNGKCPEAMMVPENKKRRKCGRREKEVEAQRQGRKEREVEGSQRKGVSIWVDQCMLTCRLSRWPQNLYIYVFSAQAANSTAFWVIQGSALLLQRHYLPPRHFP